MTNKHGKISFGKDDSGSGWFAYTHNGSNDWVYSQHSQEEAFMRLCNILANKLDNIQTAINKCENPYN